MNKVYFVQKYNVCKEDKRLPFWFLAQVPQTLGMPLRASKKKYTYLNLSDYAAVW